MKKKPESKTPQKRGKGQPTLYTAERARKICARIRQGCTRESAALLSGVSLRSLFAWMEKYPAFMQAVRKADAAFEEKCVKAIAKAGQKPRTWTANAFLLERKFPERFGKIDRYLVATGQARDGKPDGQEYIDAVCRALGADGPLVPIGQHTTISVEYERGNVEPRPELPSAEVDAAFLPDQPGLNRAPDRQAFQPAEVVKPEDNPTLIHRPAERLQTSTGIAVLFRGTDKLSPLPPGEPQPWRKD
jgi:hypothetical protein